MTGKRNGSAKMRSCSNVTNFYSTQNCELDKRKLFNQRRRQTQSSFIFLSYVDFDLRRNVNRSFSESKNSFTCIKFQNTFYTTGSVELFAELSLAHLRCDIPAHAVLLHVVLVTLCLKDELHLLSAYFVMIQAGTKGLLIVFFRNVDLQELSQFFVQHRIEFEVDKLCELPGRSYEKDSVLD